MNFTLTMLLLRLLLGAVSSFGAGFVAAWIAQRNVAVRILAGVLLVLFLPVHYTLWDKFPAWYHVTFLLSLVLATLLGAMCHSRYVHSRTGRTERSDRPGRDSMD